MDKISNLVQLLKLNIEANNGYVLPLDMPFAIDDDDVNGILLVEELLARRGYDIPSLMANLADLVSWIPVVMAMGYAGKPVVDSGLFSSSEAYTNVQEAQAIVGGDIHATYRAALMAQYWMTTMLKMAAGVNIVMPASDEEE